jgi:cytochrome c-type biogenesis protein CcmH
MKRLITVLMVLTLALSGPASAVEPQASLPQLEDEVMCPICGTLLGLSHAPAAERQRVFIRKMIREGADEQEIKDALVAEYGPQVLALPDDEGINLWAYVVPVIVFVLAGLAVVWTVLRMRRNRKNQPPPGGPASGPSSGDSQKLDEDLARYDL